MQEEHFLGKKYQQRVYMTPQYNVMMHVLSMRAIVLYLFYSH
jgi:hypothetical protein